MAKISICFVFTNYLTEKFLSNHKKEQKHLAPIEIHAKINRVAPTVLAPYFMFVTLYVRQIVPKETICLYVVPNHINTVCW